MLRAVLVVVGSLKQFCQMLLLILDDRDEALGPSAVPIAQAPREPSRHSHSLHPNECLSGIGAPISGHLSSSVWGDNTREVKLVGREGIEPPTSAMCWQRSTDELRAFRVYFGRCPGAHSDRPRAKRATRP